MVEFNNLAREPHGYPRARLRSSSSAILCLEGRPRRRPRQRRGAGRLGLLARLGGFRAGDASSRALALARP